MQAAKSSAAKVAKEDNLFGVCAALGEDFGFNPLWLRIALSVGILWNPMAMIGGYAVLGVIVGLSRLLVPNVRRDKSVEQEEGGAVASLPTRSAQTVEGNQAPEMACAA